MSYEFDGERYAANSVLQRNIGIPIIDELNLRGDEYVLDLGCGDGALTAQLAERAPRGHVTGMDASTGMLDTARKYAASNLSFVLADMTRLEETEAYDVVFSNAALHWIIDHANLLSRVYTCLKPGGYVRWNFAADGNCPNFFSIAQRLIKAPDYKPLFVNFTWPWFMPGRETYENLLQQTAFRDVRVWTEPVERRFPDADELIAWIDQPSIVPFVTHLSDGNGTAFRNELIDGMRAATAQPDGTFVEQFMRLNVFARK